MNEQVSKRKSKTKSNKENIKRERKVRYQEHGILSKSSIYNNSIFVDSWEFQSSNREIDFGDASIIDILDHLSEEGYELVCYSDEEGYILRSKDEIENLRYYEDEME